MMTIWMKGWGTPDSTTIFGCDLKVKSIHKEEFCNKSYFKFVFMCLIFIIISTDVIKT